MVGRSFMINMVVIVVCANFIYGCRFKEVWFEGFVIVYVLFEELISIYLES